MAFNASKGGKRDDQRGQNKFGGRNNKNNKNRKPDGPKLPLGIFQHSPVSPDLFVLKITSQDFPFPNQPVFLHNQVVGKTDEVYGKFEESYVSVITDSGYGAQIDENGTFYCNKFLKREWLLPRVDSLDKKEKKDKKTGSGEQNKFNRSGGSDRKPNKFDKSKGNNFKRGDQKRGGNNKTQYNQKKKMIKFD